MEKIYPLGKRSGIGSFDTFWDIEKYKTLQEAISKNDVIIVDFVKDDDDIIYFEFYWSYNPEEKIYQILTIQHFPLGVDIRDDRLACIQIQKMLNR